MNISDADITLHNIANVGKSDACSAAIIAKGGKIIYDERFGYSDYERKLPLERNAMWRLASMSKPITAAAAMLLYDRGLLSLDDTAARYIPELSKVRVGRADGKGGVEDLGAPARQILIRDLLTHSSGLGSGEVSGIEWPLFRPKNGETLADVIPRLVQSHLEFSPGEGLSYSPRFALDTLGYICELISGMSFAEFLDKNLFAPLGITDITFHPTEDQWRRTVKLYRAENEGLRYDGYDGMIFEETPLTYTSGAGGLLGSCEDYMKFAEMLRGGGILNGVRVLAEDTVKLMCSPLMPEKFSSLDTHWGAAMRIVNNDIDAIPRHTYGWSGAYGTHFYIDPTNDIAAVFCINMTMCGGSGSLNSREFERDSERFAAEF